MTWFVYYVVDRDQWLEPYETEEKALADANALYNDKRRLGIDCEFTLIKGIEIELKSDAGAWVRVEGSPE